MAPSMLHILSELSPLSTDQEVKDMILANYSDIPSTAKVAAKLQNMQMSPNEPLVSFNSRYEVIHRVAFGLSPNEQYNRTALVEYVKKLPQNMKEKLLQKIAKKDYYIRTLDDAFKQAVEINRESSFVDVASGRYSEQNAMKIDTQINELDDSFQDCDKNAMSTRSTNRSAMDLSSNPFVCQNQSHYTLNCFGEKKNPNYYNDKCTGLLFSGCNLLWVCNTHGDS